MSPNRSDDPGHIYQTDQKTRHLLHGAGATVVALLLGVTPLHLFGWMEHPIPPAQLAVLDLIALGAAALLSSKVEKRVILRDDSIEVSWGLSTRRLRVDEILGRRMGRLPTRVGGSSYYIIVPKDASKREVKFPPFIRTDPYFFEWLEKIPKTKERPPRFQY